MYTHVQSSMIHSIQNVEMIQMSVEGRMDKLVVV